MMNFDEYKNKGLRFYKRVARELETSDDPGYVERLVICLLHVLRERLTIEESQAVLSFLPMHLKGVYVHGWKLCNTPKILSSEGEFINALRIKYPFTNGKNLGDDVSLKNDIKTVFRVMQQESNSKGLSDIKLSLPEVLHIFCEGRHQESNIGTNHLWVESNQVHAG